MGDSQRIVVGLALIIVGVAVIGARTVLGRAQQNSGMPFKDMRQGRGWFRVAVLNQVGAGLVFIGIGTAVLLGVPAK